MSAAMPRPCLPASTIVSGVNNGMGSATVPYSVLIRPDGTVAYVQGGYEAPSPGEPDHRLHHGERIRAMKTIDLIGAMS
jgi:hypothetical protein